MTDLDFGAFDALTFDCYGTLIDWESGHPRRAPAGPRRRRGWRSATTRCSRRSAGPSQRSEAVRTVATERSSPRSLATIAGGLGVSPSDAAVAAFGGSVADWPPFPDSAAALARLHERFRLGVITNCDDDLFAASARRLGIEFDWVITAQQAGSYKPSERNFQLAFERIDVPRERILHVAQSLFHDHVPAKRLGPVDGLGRPAPRTRPAAAPRLPASATPDLTVPDMATLAEVALG